MNRQEYLLACLSEEAGEITQAVGKIQRFGVAGTNKGKSPTTNGMNLITEIHQLIGVYDLLREEGYITYLSIDDELAIEEAKQEKLLRLMEESRKLGLLYE